ncbi:hypothetical protein [Marinicellulosiphila megalodicopiae]|uniref:hypothetical protein n=1 Tax=Marinicellulosiphila megalodicopiae TaxID=2724896 RepID=UPI003BB1B035
MLNSFFYPPKVEGSNRKLISLNEIININDANGILITGSLGQGKSILLKYLQFLELNTGHSIPIFIELRKIKDPDSMINEACKKINMLGLSCSLKLFSFLLGEGKLSIFMDGFDETPLEKREDFNSKIS